MGQGRDVSSLQGRVPLGGAQLQRPLSSGAQLRQQMPNSAHMRPALAINVQLQPPTSVEALMQPSRPVSTFMRPPSTTAQMRLPQSVGDHILQSSRCGHPQESLHVSDGPQSVISAGDMLDSQQMHVYENSFLDNVSASFEDMPSNDMVFNGSMAANGNYYTNMMREDSHQVDFEDLSTPCIEKPSQKVQETPSASSARPNHKRSKNFNEKEDEILVAAWLNVSLDPITGANQTHKSYWTRIYDYFHEHLPFPSERTQSSLMHRWSAIQDSVNKFTGCLSRIEGRRQSGATMQDKIEDARKLFKSEDRQKKEFQFSGCWKQLRGQAKWNAKLDELAAAKSSNKKQKETSNSNLATPSLTTTEGREVAAAEDNTLLRPPGHKKAKTAQYQSGKKGSTEALENLWTKKKEFDTDKELNKDERFKQAYALEQERVANEKLNLELKELKLKAREVELMNMKEEERIMKMDLSAISDDDLKQYYMICRSKILSHNHST